MSPGTTHSDLHRPNVASALGRSMGWVIAGPTVPYFGIAGHLRLYLPIQCLKRNLCRKNSNFFQNSGQRMDGKGLDVLGARDAGVRAA
jgi:hypothetical protein